MVAASSTNTNINMNLEARYLIAAANCMDGHNDVSLARFCDGSFCENVRDDAEIGMLSGMSRTRHYHFGSTTGTVLVPGYVYLPVFAYIFNYEYIYC